MTSIDGFDVYELPCPLGRTIGDNSCFYDQMKIIAVCLKTADGHVGWGYSEVMTSGNFTRPAWWVRPLASLSELKEIFNKHWWPHLHNQNPLQLEALRKTHKTDDTGIDRATRLALWDLIGQCHGKPLYQLLNGSVSKKIKQAYASPLDFHLSDEDTTALVKRFVNSGFKVIKIKIGAPDAERDVRRLKMVKEAAGNNIKLTADANEAWDWKTTLERLEQFEKAGINLQYLEDPLHRADINGFHELTSRSPVPIIGNDYVDNLDDMRKMIEHGHIKGIRTFKDFDYMKGCIKLADEFELPVYIGNSQFEVSVHAAVAFPQVQYIEFADLAWNDLVTEPVQFIDGFAIAPERPGHGLVPKPELLKI